MVDTTGHFCVLGTATKERHLAFAEGLLSDYEKLTRKTLTKLQNTEKAATKPEPLLANMNYAVTAARIMQSSLRESLDKTTDRARAVSCGGNDATSCGECMGPENHPSACNGDCMFDGQMCILKPSAKSYAFGGDTLKIPDGVDYAYMGIKKQKVSCGGVDADRCELCDAQTGEGASQCHGDCYWSAEDVCIPKFETMQRHTRDAEDSLKTLLQLVEHGYNILKSDKEKVDVSNPANGLEKQFPTGGKRDLHKLGDRDLDMVNGMIPDIAKLLKRSEVQLEKALPQVSCGGTNADSCAECMPNPGSGHDMDAMYCNGDCHFHRGECVLTRAAALLQEADAAKQEDKTQAAAQAREVRHLRIEDTK